MSKCGVQELRVQPSAPSLPSFVTCEEQHISTGSQVFAGFTHVRHSHDSKQKPHVDGHGWPGGRPPLGSRGGPTSAFGNQWAPIPFSDLGLDRKYRLAGTNHDCNSVV